MRYLVGFAFLPALVASPLSVSAQDALETTPAEPDVEAPPPSPTAAPEEPALQLKLDDAGVEVTPTPPRTFEGYALEEPEVRVKRARTWFYVSGGLVGAGLVMAMVAGLVSVAQWGKDKPFDRAEAALAAALAISSAGVLGVVVAGGIMVHRKRKARKYGHCETPRRVQWDLARSRLVF